MIGRRRRANIGVRDVVSVSPTATMSSNLSQRSERTIFESALQAAVENPLRLQSTLGERFSLLSSGHDFSERPNHLDFRRIGFATVVFVRPASFHARTEVPPAVVDFQLVSDGLSSSSCCRKTGARSRRSKGSHDRPRQPRVAGSR